VQTLDLSGMDRVPRTHAFAAAACNSLVPDDAAIPRPLSAVAVALLAGWADALVAGAGRDERARLTLAVLAAVPQ